MSNDKPVITAQQAQQAAAVANEVHGVAQAASSAIAAVPGTYSTKTLVLRILGVTAAAAGVVGTALSLGTVPALITGGVGLTTLIIGLFQPSPAAVSNYGQAAK